MKIILYKQSECLKGGIMSSMEGTVGTWYEEHTYKGVVLSDQKEKFCFAKIEKKTWQVRRYYSHSLYK